MLLAHGELPLECAEDYPALSLSESDGQDIKTVREALASVDQLRLDCLAALGLPGFKARSRKQVKKAGSSSSALRSLHKETSGHDEALTAAEFQTDTDEDDVPLAVRQRRRLSGGEGREGGDGPSVLGAAEMPATPSESTDQGITIDLVRLSSSSTSDVSLASDRCTEGEDGINSGSNSIKEDLASDSSGGIDLVREASPPVIILDEAGHVQQTGVRCRCGLAGGVTPTLGRPQSKDDNRPAGMARVQGSRLGPKGGRSINRIGLSGIGIQRKRKPSSMARREDRAAPTYTPGQEAAWKAAAATWRQRNAPSASEISRAAAAAAATASGGKSMRTPAQRAAWSEAETPIGGVGMPNQVPLPPPRPTGEAPEAEWRAYFRAKHHVRGKGLSFAALLRLYGSASDDSLRAQYHVAVRRYHPDSNSPYRVWRSDRQRLECEEIMKLINAQKPHSL